MPTSKEELKYKKDYKFTDPVLASMAKSFIQKPSHYWQYLTTKLSDLQSVEFLAKQKNSEDDKINGITWVVLALNHLTDLESAF